MWKKPAVRRRIKRLLIYMLTPFVLIGLSEMLLRYAGYGQSSELFLPAPNAESYLVQNNGFAKSYFPFSKSAPVTISNRLKMPKETGSLRIFLIGENSLSGYPWGPNGTISAFLKPLLREAFSEREVEIINLSIPGINSHAMLDISGKLSSYDPNAVIIYPGHNEFYGALGPASVDYVGMNRGSIKLYLDLHRYRLFQFLQSVYIYVSADADESSELRSSIKKIQIKSGSAIYKQTIQNFESNIREILLTAESGGWTLIGLVPVSNFSGKIPFRSCSDGIADLDKWSREVEKGKMFLYSGENEKALLYFEEAEERYGTNADLDYLIASAAESSGDVRKARIYYRCAVDTDCLPFRAPTVIGRRMAELFREFDQPILSVGAHFDSISVNGTRGNDFFLDAVHFSIRGTALVAERMASEIIGRFGGMRRPEPDMNEIDELIDRAGITDIDEAIAELRITSLRSEWPYKESERTVPSFSNLRSDHIENLAYEVVEGRINWFEAHRIYADSLFDLGYQVEAEDDYRALTVAEVRDVVPYQRLSEVLIRKGLFEEAYELLDNSLKIERTFFAVKWMGSILLVSGIAEDAIELLLEAYEMNSSDVETIYNLTTAYIETGKVVEAKESLKRLILLSPGYEGSLELVAKIKELENH